MHQATRIFIETSVHQWTSILFYVFQPVLFVKQVSCITDHIALAWLVSAGIDVRVAKGQKGLFGVLHNAGLALRSCRVSKLIHELGVNCTTRFI